MDLESFIIDCANCSGLCCTALHFSKSEGFPENKIAGRPCLNLMSDFTCKVHDSLKELNYKGCMSYDCFGAGQYVTQNIFKGETWKNYKKTNVVYDVFNIIQQLFEVRYYLIDSLRVSDSLNITDDLVELIDENIRLCSLPYEEMLSINMQDIKTKSNVLLKRICADLTKTTKVDTIGYLGKSFKSKDFSNTDLSMKLLIASDFSFCNFNQAVFIGADTRDTNFTGADLSKALFLTQRQLNASTGNKETRLPKHLEYPTNWK